MLIALLNASGEYGFTDDTQMYNAMRKKAAKLGANGVILDAITEPSTGAVLAGALLPWEPPAQRTGKAVAIYVSSGPTAKN
jgi:hypothetical protein